MSETPFRPRPAGAVAILSHPFLPEELKPCREHPFQLHEPVPVRVTECESGYLQRATCLVCDRTTSRMDATWWTASPTPEAVAASIRELEAAGRDASRLRALTEASAS
ncbi:MAG: hypothetical protein ACOY93_19005 [Bacillota bacterium]